MTSYITILVLTCPILASNNAGETEGNVQTLQAIRSPKGERSVLSGYSIRYGLRDGMQALGANVWRKVTDEGYRYGDNDSASMLEGGSPVGYADGAFGHMAAMSNSKKNKQDEGGDEQSTVKLPSAVFVSSAISTSLFKHDRAFVLGRKEDGTPNPFGRERHYTRYQFTITINIKDAAKKGLDLDRLFTVLRSFRVGGSHAANATEMIPEVIAWRFHNTPGSGLYLSPGTDISPDGEIDLSPLTKRAENIGVSFEVAGTGVNKTVDAGLTEILGGIKAILNS